MIKFMIKLGMRPLLELRFCALWICMIGLSRIVCVAVSTWWTWFLGPTSLVEMIRAEDANVVVELGRFMGLFSIGALRFVSLESKSGLLCLFACSLILALLLMISGVFLFLRRPWARKTVILLIALEILVHLAVLILRGKSAIRVMPIEQLLLFILLLFVLTRRQIVGLFHGRNAVETA